MVSHEYLLRTASDGDFLFNFSILSDFLFDLSILSAALFVFNIFCISLILIRRHTTSDVFGYKNTSQSVTSGVDNGSVDSSGDGPRSGQVARAHCFGNLQNSARPISP